MTDDLPVPATVLLYAFRYALGRHTGAPDDVAAQLERHAHQLPSWMRQQIVQDIDDAITRGEAGRWRDIQARWRQCADRLTEAPDV